MVTLTVLPILASAAVASADPPAPVWEAPEPTLSPPGMTEPAELSPPGLTPEIWELTCDDDPNRDLRTDCEDRRPRDGHAVIRGGFGGYFHLSGGSGGGSHGGSSGGG